MAGRELAGSMSRCCAACPPRFVLFTVLVKILMYGSSRLIYPFVSFLAADWGLSTAQMGVVLAAGEWGAVPAGFIASLGDQLGNRKVGLVFYAVFLASSLAMLLPPTLVGLAATRVFLHLSAVVYVIVNQSTLVASVGQDGAGWITGLTETSWALSILTMIPLLSLAYTAWGWRALFGLPCLVIALLFTEVWWDYPADAPAVPSAPSAAASAKEAGVLAQSWRSLSRSRYMRALCLAGPLIFNLSSMVFNVGQNILFLGFAIWAAEVHGLDPEQMGGLSFGVGVCELAGSLAVLVWSDRIGLYRAVYWGAAVSAFSIALFAGVASVSFHGGLALGCLTFIASEVVIVCQIAVVERFVSSDLRTSLLGINFQCHFLGRGIGALLAEPVWRAGGLAATGASGAAASAVCLLLVWAASAYLPDGNECEPSAGTMPGMTLADAQEVEAAAVAEEVALATKSSARLGATSIKGLGRDDLLLEGRQGFESTRLVSPAAGTSTTQYSTTTLAKV
jgi:predicted MFS family arabinose efflux permease